MNQDQTLSIEQIEHKEKKLNTLRTHAKYARYASRALTVISLLSFCKELGKGFGILSDRNSKRKFTLPIISFALALSAEIYAFKNEMQAEEKATSLSNYLKSIGVFKNKDSKPQALEVEISENESSKEFKY
ncbi:MAG: hypothetical protein SFW66_08130 [Gammaproteobacteria bacterium]|nr:hypothetical protein [Gammaproteobacteria bacterium]